MNPETNRIYVANSASDTVTVLNGDTTRVLAQMPVGSSPRKVGINPKSNRIYVTCYNDAGSVLNNLAVRYGKELLANPSFDGDGDGDGRPDGWAAESLGADDLLVEDPYDGRFSMKIVGVSGTDKSLTQTTPISRPAGTVVNVEGFTKSQNTSPFGGPYSLEVQVIYADNSSASFGISFAEGTNDWHRGINRLVTQKDFKQLITRANYMDQRGAAWFDGIHLWFGRY